MALPAHLQRYDGLIDLLVERLLCEIEQEAETKTPDRASTSDPAQISSARSLELRDKNTPTRADAQTSLDR
jgi:hypothetical protein